ncbi:hypothetical protein KP79_PYT12370 [Mizuhopecten yessoensis]|uniref:Uncharacterized protein n=1 Tax=Mizuhopecten yessoensis TaxID=6573 RepID=A0A210PLA0_MIZYE|nr:hypothetical protein KP79_PYT12370 [Mizuhopecten yessoensis]
MKSSLQVSLVLATLVCISGNVDGVTLEADPLDDDCDVIYVDKTEVKTTDYVCEPLRTVEYISLWERLIARLYEHPRAFNYIHGLTHIEKVNPHMSVGTPVCPSKTKKIFGYFKLHGRVLCLVVRPDLQQVEHVTCAQKSCCNDASLCLESGFYTQRYLVFCDFFIPSLHDSIDLISDDPGLCDVDALLEDHEPDAPNAPNGPSKRSVAPFGYFAFKFSKVPSTCSCGQCNWI